jgi:hypothetical protein
MAQFLSPVFAQRPPKRNLEDNQRQSDASPKAHRKIHRQRARWIGQASHSRSMPYPYASVSSLAEGVTIDTEGNVCGACFLNDVRKFVLKKK